MSNEGRVGHGTRRRRRAVDPRRLAKYRHSRGEFLMHYRRLAARDAAKKLPGLRGLAPEMVRLISDEKTLYAALNTLRAEGSPTPGPDGVRYQDIAAGGDWAWCRAVRDTIRGGHYSPGRERVHKIPKGPGRGTPTLVVQSVEDRVVQRAAVEILQPLLDPLFDPLSFGFRPKKGPLRALAAAERLTRDRGPGVWVSVDIRDAFGSVPLGRLIDVVRKYLPDDELVEFVETLARSEKVRGLRQGGPLSPLLLNLYLHHTLDRPWRGSNPDAPLVRFADDIVLLCQDRLQAGDAYRALLARLRSAGLKLKECEADAVRDLAGGESVTWMGFAIGGTPEGLKYGVTGAAWDSLAEKFAAAHGRANSPLVAYAAIEGWVQDKAQCYPEADRGAAYARMKSLAQEEGFDEVPAPRRVERAWQLAYARWCKLRAASPHAPKLLIGVGS